MARFKFDGFATGAAAALTVSQAAVTVSGSVPAWGIGGASVAIDETRPATLVDPAGVWLEAANETGFTWDSDPGTTGYVPAHHELTYVWTVEKETSPGVWQTGQLPAFSTPGNLLSGWNDPNIAYGHQVAFFFTEGTWRVQLWAVHLRGPTAGRVATATSSTFTVQAYTDAYAAADQIYFSPDNDFAGCPSGSTQVTTLSGVQSAINAASNPCCVLYRRGETYTYGQIGGTAQAIELAQASATTLEYIGSYESIANPSSARPIVRIHENNRGMVDFDGFNRQWFMVAGIELQGGYDGVTETSPKSDLVQKTEVPTQSWMLCIFDCRIDGVGINEFDTRGSSEGYVLVGDTEVTNWNDMGIYSLAEGGPEQSTAIVGCKIAHDPDASQGWGPKSSGNLGQNTHGCLRFSAHDRVYFAMSQWMSKVGWTGGWGYGTVGADQPCTRLYNDGAFVSVNWDRNTFEGNISFDVVSSSTQVADVVVDKALVIPTAATGSSLIDVRCSGSTWRNMIFVNPDRPQFYHNSLSIERDTRRAFVFEAKGSYTQDVLDAPVWCYNNTYLDLRTGSNVGTNGFTELSQNSGAAALNLTEQNNVIHAADPNHTTTATTYAPIDTTTDSGVSPIYKGVKPNWLPVEGTLSASNTSSGTGNVAQNETFSIPWEDLDKDTALELGAATDKTYWDAELGTRHAMRIGPSFYTAAFSSPAFSVTTDTNGLVIENLTVTTWTNGTAFSFRAHRPNDMPDFWGTPSTEFTSVGKLIPLPHPQSGSAALDVDTGLKAYDDALLRVRPNADIATDHAGNAVAPSGNASGALLPA